MEAEEIMIGDWVRYKSDSPDNAFPVKVDYNMFCNELHKWKDRFEPIEITPEILEKNGFVDASCGKKLKYEMVYINGNCQLNYITKYSVFSIYVKNEKDNYLWGLIRPNDWYKAFWGEIKYVHELQHTLRLCGIEKDIIL